MAVLKWPSVRLRPAQPMRENLTPFLKSAEEPCCQFSPYYRSYQKHPQFRCVSGNNCRPKLARRIQATASLRAEQYNSEPDQNSYQPGHERGKRAGKESEILDCEN